MIHRFESHDGCWLSQLYKLLSPNPTITGSCSGNRIPSGDPYFHTLVNMCNQLVLQTGSYSYHYDYKTSSVGIGGSPTAYGQAICNRILPRQNCTLCIISIWNASYGICSTFSAKLQSATAHIKYCFVKYEDYPFSINYSATRGDT